MCGIVLALFCCVGNPFLLCGIVLALFCCVGKCFHSGCQLLSQLTNLLTNALASLELLTNADIISYVSVHSRSMLLYIIDTWPATP
jgi:hypothetical protein